MPRRTRASFPLSGEVSVAPCTAEMDVAPEVHVAEPVGGAVGVSVEGGVGPDEAAGVNA